MNILAEITGIKYTPFLCNNLTVFEFHELDVAMRNSCFILQTNNHNKMAVSWWVSSKRTRSYPYARVYNTLSFIGKRITIIPIYKDEGRDGDRDFLQWDTISLMSLLGVYTIVAYYKQAEKNIRFKNKITKQQFDLDYIKTKIDKLQSYQSDALHWNIDQIEEVGDIGLKALQSYTSISKEINVEMHSFNSAEARIKKLSEGKDIFKETSRILAEKAQQRESVTIQPKEFLKDGNKGIITIKNYLGGLYYLTCDEVEIEGNT